MWCFVFATCPATIASSARKCSVPLPMRSSDRCACALDESSDFCTRSVVQRSPARSATASTAKAVADPLP